MGWHPALRASRNPHRPSFGGTVALTDRVPAGDGAEVKRRRRQPTSSVELSAFAGFRFAVRWYLRFGLSYRDLEELLAERGIDVDHMTLSVREGARVTSPIQDEHGWRLGRIIDPFGHEWEIGRPLGAWPPQ